MCPMGQITLIFVGDLLGLTAHILFDSILPKPSMVYCCPLTARPLENTQCIDHKCSLITRIGATDL
jgi:hypothetical protein